MDYLRLISSFLLFTSSTGLVILPESILDHKAKYATIPHKMGQESYPFDETGKYRVDWVRPKDSLEDTGTYESSVTVRGPIKSDSKEHSNYLIKVWEMKGGGAWDDGLNVAETFSLVSKNSSVWDYYRRE